jgi:amino acid adenylation domain-containing protein
MLLGWMDPERDPDDQLDVAFRYEHLDNFSEILPDYQNTPEDAAHILFTSGSTGEPKGVVTKHSNDIAFVEWACEYFGIRHNDRLSSHTPLHFDLSTLDIYGTISSGAELHIIPAEYNLIPSNLSRFIRDYKLTQWFSVPSILNYMSKFDAVKHNDFPSLERLIWCGEVFPVPALRYWMERLPHVTFTNLYGPTETTVASSYYTVPEIPEDNNVDIPIGEACKGEQLHVLDEELNPVPAGETGELYISGVGVSKGYWKDPERTEEVFLTDPSAEGNGRIIYKTGDLAHFGEDGLCYFHGRVDNQIKSRGYRIELGEIESALNSLQMTMECAVVAISTEGFEGQAICCAFVPVKDGEIGPKELEKKLKGLLPGYMIPHYWEIYSVLPKNKNGKINRKKIASRFQHNETQVDA